ncbi:hypothetical protein NDU88_007267 [Pleurodeles waltl]|uniref:Uncharacterized protein n=1 Tax=Pleurodeles waltl TaxID=8319 RepID=A0AAV7QRD0_PLEWA|nr:hypothetical protein NDU88_007267 [Pleurodeles waltl]
MHWYRACSVPAQRVFFMGLHDPTAGRTGLCQILHRPGLPSGPLLMFSLGHRPHCRRRCGLSGLAVSLWFTGWRRHQPRTPLSPRSCLGRSGFTPGPTSPNKPRSTGR